MLSRLVLVVGLAACASGIARAETASFCNQYASKALHDAQQVRSNPKCNARNLHGGVFSTDYNVHYTWCLRVDANRAHAGTAQREAYLNRCAAAPGPARPAVQNMGGQQLTDACKKVYNGYLKLKGPKAFAVSVDRRNCGRSNTARNVQEAQATAVRICVNINGGACNVVDSSNR